jgi:hypothetical protein
MLWLATESEKIISMVIDIAFGFVCRALGTPAVSLRLHHRPHLMASPGPALFRLKTETHRRVAGDAFRRVVIQAATTAAAQFPARGQGDLGPGARNQRGFRR